MRLRGALITAGVLASVLGSARAGGAVPDPVFTATPSPVALGGTVELTISGCVAKDPGFVGVGIEVRFQDTPGGGVPLKETAPGTWTGQIDIGTNRGEDDLYLHPSCGVWEGDVVAVDVDNPKLFATPFDVPPITPPDPVEGFFGTDCPPGTPARVLFQAQGRPAPELRTGALDGRGDWDVTVPAFPRGTAVEVSASCGSVTYPSYSYTAGGSQYATTTTTAADGASSSATTPAGPGPGGGTAAPASPVAGTPGYTG